VNIWRELAKRFGDVKFGQMRADLCIEGYPDRNTPTVLVYKDGEIRKQLVTLGELRGVRTTVEDLEKVLVEVGAVKRGDVRLEKRTEEEGKGNGGRGGIWTGKRNATVEDDEDDDFFD